MSEPEIARRCSHCGVSLRQSALFCPQCGQPIPDSATHTTVSETAVPQATIRENPRPALSSSSHVSSVRERVEQIRHVSSVVIDQAAYDPSLRFILVAAVLFVLFLVLLILSKVIG